MLVHDLKDWIHQHKQQQPLETEAMETETGGTVETKTVESERKKKKKKKITQPDITTEHDDPGMLQDRRLCSQDYLCIKGPRENHQGD